MNPDLVYIINYECPRCHAALEIRSDGVPSWLRCPHCGKASLPPEPVARSNRPPLGFESLGVNPSPGGPLVLPTGPRPMAPMPRAPLVKPQTNRILMGSGFLLSIVLTLLSMIEGNAARAAVFGLTSALLIFFLTRPTAPNRP